MSTIVNTYSNRDRKSVHHHIGIPVHHRLEPVFTINWNRCSPCLGIRSLLPRLYEVIDYLGKREVDFHIEGAIKLCTSCGHTEFVNAIVLGLINPQTGELVDG